LTLIHELLETKMFYTATGTGLLDLPVELLEMVIDRLIPDRWNYDFPICMGLSDKETSDYIRQLLSARLVCSRSNLSI
jgi:hypothetical protein